MKAAKTAVTALCTLRGIKWMADVKQVIAVTLAQINSEWEIVL